jgi:hypothetical protein
MRVKIISTADGWSVLKWIPKAKSIDDAWRQVRVYPRDQYEDACKFATDLSLSKEAHEVVFEDGVEVKSPLTGCDPKGGDHSYNSVT